MLTHAQSSTSLPPKNKTVYSCTVLSHRKMNSPPSPPGPGSPSTGGYPPEPEPQPEFPIVSPPQSPPGPGSPSTSGYQPEPEPEQEPQPGSQIAFGETLFILYHENRRQNYDAILAINHNEYARMAYFIRNLAVIAAFRIAESTIKLVIVEVAVQGNDFLTRVREAGIACIGSASRQLLLEPIWS